MLYGLLRVTVPSLVLTTEGEGTPRALIPLASSFRGSSGAVFVIIFPSQSES